MASLRLRGAHELGAKPLQIVRVPGRDPAFLNCRFDLAIEKRAPCQQPGGSFGARPSAIDMIAGLEASGTADPEGRAFAAAYGRDEVHMFEVLVLPQDFDAHCDPLFGVLQGAGVDADTVEVHPLSD